MVHLLKASSKIGVALKPRKKHMAFMPNPNGSDNEQINLKTLPQMANDFSQKQP
jgi:hypothetical protein